VGVTPSTAYGLECSVIDTLRARTDRFLKHRGPAAGREQLQRRVAPASLRSDISHGVHNVPRSVAVRARAEDAALRLAQMHSG
jgi:hypothetical protein